MLRSIKIVFTEKYTQWPMTTLKLTFYPILYRFDLLIALSFNATSEVRNPREKGNDCDTLYFSTEIHSIILLSHITTQI